MCWSSISWNSLETTDRSDGYSHPTWDSNSMSWDAVKHWISFDLKFRNFGILRTRCIRDSIWFSSRTTILPDTERNSPSEDVIILTPDVGTDFLRFWRGNFEKPLKKSCVFFFTESSLHPHQRQKGIQRHLEAVFKGETRQFFHQKRVPKMP